VSAAKGQDEDGDEWEIDEPEGVVEEMRREDGAGGGAEEESEDDAGEFAKFTQAGFALCGGEGVI
jgi:hypothetical protein